ncbi:MAG: alpha/beta fold hydrolase [Actinobacteria bacterium]|nr:MAG: alpha/beta fold hydrolase [Actinomycetota bacterium]
MGGPLVDEHTISVDQAPIFYRSAPVPSGVSTPLYLHGVPTSSDDWSGLLERTGGIAPDLIGFGRSSKAANLDYTLAGLATFLERFLVEVGAERVTIVAHDWGAAAGLVFAQRRPQAIDRLVLCDAVPLLDGSPARGMEPVRPGDAACDPAPVPGHGRIRSGSGWGRSGAAADVGASAVGRAGPVAGARVCGRLRTAPAPCHGAADRSSRTLAVA